MAQLVYEHGNNGHKVEEVATREDIDICIRYLLLKNHYPLSGYHKLPDFMRGVVSSDYAMYIHPDLKEDFEGISGFIKRDYYPTKGLEDEIGSIGNMRIFIKDSLDRKQRDYVCLCFGSPSGVEGGTPGVYVMQDFYCLTIKK